MRRINDETWVGIVCLHGKTRKVTSSLLSFVEKDLRTNVKNFVVLLNLTVDRETPGSPWVYTFEHTFSTDIFKSVDQVRTFYGQRVFYTNTIDPTLRHINPFISSSFSINTSSLGERSKLMIHFRDLKR